MTIKWPASPLPFDPFALTLEERMQMGLDGDELMQCVMAAGLTSDREKIEQGTGMEVLQAVETCLNYKLPAPDWLRDVYKRRLHAVTSHQTASWDDPLALGRPYPKGAHLARLRKDRGAGPVVCYYVRRILEKDPERAIDDSIFEETAAHFAKNVKGLGKTECQRLYYKYLADHEAVYGPMPTKSQRIAAIQKPS